MCGIVGAEVNGVLRAPASGRGTQSGGIGRREARPTGAAACPKQVPRGYFALTSGIADEWWCAISHWPPLHS